MKVLICSIIGLFLSATCVFAENASTLSYLNRWPSKSSHVIVKIADYVFHGDGETITVYNTKTDPDLTPVSRVRIRLTPASGLSGQQASGTEGISGMFYDGDLLYVACGNEGLQIYDVPADPADFSETDRVGGYIVEKEDSRAIVRDVVAAGNYAYIGYYRLSNQGYDSGIQAIDVSDPTHPVLAGETEFPQSFAELKRVESLTIAGNYVYATDMYNGLVVFDIAVPSTPVIEAVFYISSAMDVSVSGVYAYVAAVYGVAVVNIDPANFTDDVDVLSSVATCQYNDSQTKAFTVAADGNYAYIGDLDLGLVILDISDPESINNNSVIGQYDTDAQGVYSLYLDDTAGKNIYIGDCRKGLQKIDVTDPANTALLADVKNTGTPADADDVYVDTATSYVFTVDDDASSGEIKEGLRIFFAIVSEDYVSFLLKGFFPTDGEATSLYFYDGLIYLADGSGGLKIINPGLPEKSAEVVNPSLTAGLAIADGNVNGVFVKKDDDTHTYAYLAAGSGGLKVIDVSDPATPVLVGEIAGADVYDARKVDVKGDFAFVADGDNGIKTVNIADKTAPVLADTYYVGDSDDLDDVPGCAGDVSVVGTLIYGAFNNEGLHVIEAANPYELVKVAQYAATPYDSVKGVFAARSDENEGVDLIWLANGTMLDENMGFFTEPSTVPPQRIGGYHTSGDVKDVFVSSDFAFLADGAGGFQALIVNDYQSDYDDSWEDNVVPVDTHREKNSGCFIQASATDLRDGILGLFSSRR